MAFTENQLRNITGIEDEWTTVPLLPAGVMTEDEQENWVNVYIGWDYAPGAPVADFSFSVDVQTLKGTFLDLSQNQPDSWAWDFGDIASGSNTSTDQNPIHFFSGYGNFQVTLTVINGLGTSSITKTVSIVDPGMPYTVINNHAAQGKGKLIEQFKVRP